MANERYYNVEDLQNYDTHYTGPYKWQADAPITATRMNTLEAGVAEALLDTTQIDTKVVEIEGSISRIEGTANAAATQADGAARTAQSALDNTVAGTRAWEQLVPFIRRHGGVINPADQQVTGTNVDTLMQEIELDISRARTELNNARIGTSTLSDRLDAIDGTAKTTMKSALSDVILDISNIQNELHPGETASTSSTLSQKLQAIRDSIAAAQTEIDETHRADHVGDRLVNRLNEIDSTDTVLFPNSLANRINALDGIGESSLSGRVAALETELVSGVNTGALATTRLDQVYNEILLAHRGTDIVPGGDTLQFRFQSLENQDSIHDSAIAGITQAQVATNNRLDAVNNELDLTNPSSVIGTRISAIETDLDDLTKENGTLDELSDRITTNTNAISGLSTRVTTLENDTTASTAAAEILAAHRDDVQNDTLDNRFDAVEARVTAIEEGGVQGASMTIVVDDATFDEEDGTPILPNDEEPNPDADYLIKQGDKYYYWKYIDDEWNLISGGGGSGTGTSSAIIGESLPLASEADPNVDYYIGTNALGYTHYRYIPSEEENEDGVFITILPKSLTDGVGLLIKDLAVGTITVTTADASGEAPAETTQMSGNLQAYTANDSLHENNLYANFAALRHVRIKRTYEDDNTTLKKQELIFTDTNGNEMAPIEIVGGSGGSAAYSIRLVYVSNANVTIPSNTTGAVNISAKPLVNFGATLAEGVGIDASIQYKLSSDSEWHNADIVIPTITNGQPFTLDISSLLGGADTTTNIRVRISSQPEGDEGDILTQSITFNISKVTMSIEGSGYNPAAIRTGASFMFDYICHGLDLAKIVTFKIDNNVVATADVGTSHNIVEHQTISLTSLATGMHTLQVYFTTNGIQSNILNYYLICNKDASREAPLVGLACESTEISYGDDLKVNYTVYTAGQETTDEVDIEVYTMDGTEKTTVILNELDTVANSQVHTYTVPSYPENAESYTLYIALTAKKNGDPVLSETQVTSIVVNPFQSAYRLEYKGVDNLLYSYTAYGRTNNDANKDTHVYTYTAHDSNSTEITFTSNFEDFNWATNGYVNGETLTISGGAHLDIHVPVLSSTYNGTSLEVDTDNYSDPTQNGRTIEIEYSVSSATDLNATIIDCMDENHVGFQVTPQSCYFLNNSNVVNFRQDETGFIFNEENLAAAYLNTDTRMHLVFVIEPWADHKSADGAYHQSVNIYVNGEFANAAPYNRGDNSVIDSFTSDATISIGDPSCIINLYSVKLYNCGLTHRDVLQNYEMAPANIRDKIARFEKNDVLDGAGKLSYEKARRKYNCLLLVGDEPVWGENAQHEQYITNPVISPYKGSPSPIGRTKKGKIEKKTESGLILTKPNSTLDEGYQVEFRLLDKLTDGGFASTNNVQGTSSQKYPIHNLKVYLAKGDGDPDENGQYAASAKVKYSLRGSAGIGESTLCWKADYMSTDHANTYNANLADTLFNDKLPFLQENAKLQNTVNGIRCLLFQQQGPNATPEFVGDGSLNNDKGNNKTFGLEVSGDSGHDTLRQKWEFTNNSEDLGFFKTDKVFQVIGEGTDAHIRAKDGFESAYPDEGDLKDAGLQPNYNHLQLLLTWAAQRANYLAETPGTEAYNTKKALFRSEFEKHFNLNHVLTYYLFCEYTAMCDNRVKNMFMRCDDIRTPVLYVFNDQNESVELHLNDVYETTVDPESGDETTALTEVNANVALQRAGVIDASGNVDASKIDWERSTFGIWAPVLYDLDSCFGAENVGYLRIRYDADWTYRYEGAPQFNGYDSNFWLMVEDTYKDELVALARDLYNRTNGLNYRTFYQQQIVENQNSISAAMTNQDMLLKFNDPWETGFMDYSLDNPAWTFKSYKYLQRGSRAAQKASFIYRRSNLLSSRYQANAFLTDKITFRAGVPVGQTSASATPEEVAAALQETAITLKANQILYPAVQYGDNKGFIKATTNNGRVEAGQPCTIYATSSVNGNDGITIAGGSILTDIGDISAFHPYQLEVGQGKNLKKLIIGSHAAGYTNTSLSDIQNLNQCILLEEINVENCTNLTGLTLTANGLIKKVYAKGSHISTISLPNGGVLDTVEYSAYTNSIILQNQSYFQNFSYEDSENNNYGNLTTLRVENTPNVPIEDMVVKRLPNLTGGLRLVGINLNLGDDITMLEMLATEDYAKGKYLGANGGRDSSQYPYITGTVSVNNIRESLLNKLNALYPNLIVNSVNTPTKEFALTYKNVDADGNETTLITLYRTAGEQIPEPVLDTDAVTGKYYIQGAPAAQIGYNGKVYVPLRADDAQYKYKFGTYNSAGNYQRYSGWVIKENGNTRPTATTSITKPLTLLATYPDESRTIQTYTVTWYDDDGSVLYSYHNVPYGEDGSALQAPSKYNQLVPLVTKKLRNGVYKVFRGWDRPVGRVRGDINVYSQWYESIGDFSNLTAIDDLNPADFYALTQLDTSTRDILLRNHLGKDVKYINIGRDFDYDPAQITTYNLIPSGQDYLLLDADVENVKIYDQAHMGMDVFPLVNLTQDFTFAIDFKFLMDNTLWASNTQEYVLASCFRDYNSTVNGFRLVLTKSSNTYHDIQLRWGNASPLTVDRVQFTVNDQDASNSVFRTYRSVIVLRHLAAEPTKLYVYYAPPSSDPQYYNNTGVIYTDTPLEWASMVPIETPIVLGGNLDSTGAVEDSSARTMAKGIIYYAKYWAEDLGHSNCLELASWPHETIAYKISGYYDGKPSTDSSSRLILGNSSTNTINFTPAQVIGDRTYNYNTREAAAFEGDTTTATNGWSNSLVRAYVNTTVYNAFPTAYQSLIEQIKIGSVAQTTDSTTGNPTAALNQDIYDFIYLPSYYEINPDVVVGSPYRSEAIHSWQWLTTSNITNVYTLNAQGKFVQETGINTLDYLRFQFFARPVVPGARVFHMTTANNPYGRTYYDENNQPVTVQPGDIWYTGTIAYMYVSAEDILQGVQIDTTKAAGSGGWAPAVLWATRTFNYSEGAKRYAYSFMKVLRNGSIATNENVGDNNTMRALVPQFSI